ncbi:MAG: hypothetical protein JTJ12_08960, partial [Eubacterium sp.]|nr:hypothetical protein [Eubacterium sp.]
RKAAAQMINLDGTPYSVKNTFVKETFENEKEITQLQAITKYIAHFAKEHNYRAGKQLWMNPLPRYLYLEDIIEENEEKKEDKRGKEQRIQKLFCNEGIQICLGLFDDPENQEQPKFYFNLMECGHVGIGGRSVSGKSTFLQTFIFSLINKYSEKDITLYILDFNGGGMDIYAVVSQVQQVIKEEEEEKTDSLFEGIREELKRRKKMLSGGNFNQYKNRMGQEESIPLMVIVLDGFEEFCTVTYQKYEDILYQILREGEKLGILMIITVESFSGMNISMRLSDLLKTRICFYMKDTYSYTEAFNIIQIPVLPKKGIPGRGIAYYGERILEFQTALAVKDQNDYRRQEKIRQILDRGVTV